MEQQVEQTTPDAFDAAIVAESTAPPEPQPDAAKAARDAQGRFAPATADDGADPSSPPAGESEAGKVETKPAAEKKPRNDPEARIAQAIGRQREAERRAEDAERRAREVEARVSKPAEPPKAPPAADKFPRFDEWSAKNQTSTHDDYLDARDEWRDQRAAVQLRDRAETARTEQAFSARVATFSERYATAAQSDPELPKRINQELLTAKPLSSLNKQEQAELSQAFARDAAGANRFVFMCSLAEHWVDSEYGPQMLEHLSDPHVFQRLATLHPRLVSRELATFEAGLAAATDKESRGSAVKPSGSQAHPPIKPLGSAPRVPDADDGSEDESLESFIRRENAKDRKAGRLG